MLDRSDRAALVKLIAPIAVIYIVSGAFALYFGRWFGLW